MSIKKNQNWTFCFGYSCNRGRKLIKIIKKYGLNTFITLHPNRSHFSLSNSFQHVCAAHQRRSSHRTRTSSTMEATIFLLAGETQQPWKLRICNPPPSPFTVAAATAAEAQHQICTATIFSRNHRTPLQQHSPRRTSRTCNKQHRHNNATPDLHCHHLLTEPPCAIAAAFSASHITHLQQAAPTQQRSTRSTPPLSSHGTTARHCSSILCVAHHAPATSSTGTTMRWTRTAAILAAAVDAHNSGGGRAQQRLR